MGEEAWGIGEVVSYVLDRGYRRVTLQFPDDMLGEAPAVAKALQQELSACSDAKVYVLADTTYNPLSVDEVAAQHVNADCVIHYGHASLTPVTRTPALCVLPRAPLDAAAAAAALAGALREHGGDGSNGGEKREQEQAGSGGGGWALVSYDQVYAYAMGQVKELLAREYQGPLEVVFSDVAPASTSGSTGGGGGGGGGASGDGGQASSSGDGDGTGGGAADGAGEYAPPPLGGLVWRAPAAAAGAPPRAMLWLGPPSGPALTHLQLTHSGAAWVAVDPAAGFAMSTGLCDGLDRLLRRRYYLVEKARGANIIGLLVGTLGAAGYLEALEALRRLVDQAGKKAYTLLMGKPSPAKLANFPEVEVFVMVAEPQGLILECRDFLAPIITPHEALLALTGRPLDAGSYRLDYGELLSWRGGGGGGGGGGEEEEAGDSPGGGAAAAGGGGGALVAAGGLQLGLGSGPGGAAAQRQVSARSAAEYLTKGRSFQGLETPAAGAEIKAAELAAPGRAGRAAGYADEPGRAALAPGMETILEAMTIGNGRPPTSPLAAGLAAAAAGGGGATPAISISIPAGGRHGSVAINHAQSFIDCEQVLLQAAVKNPKPSTPTATHGQRGAQESLLGGELMAVVIVCEPEGSSLMMGGLHPRGSLFERPVNIESAKAHHANFRQARARAAFLAISGDGCPLSHSRRAPGPQVLREHGVKVLTVREILAHGVEAHMGARVGLETLAMRTLTYRVADGASVEEFAEGDRHYLSDAYKREVIEHMSVAQLIDIILINPTVTLMPSGRDTGFTASYTFAPLSNLVYTRDQQITTCKGIVMGCLRSAQRQREVELMRFCFNKLGMPIIGEIEAPGFLEGGDFFPCGQDLAMVGIGLRSNLEACEQLMQKDLLGTRRFAVVRDDFDKNQDRMHLDCVFSTLGSNCCIMLEDIMGEASPTRRLVDEYVRDVITGQYKLARSGVEFAAFMKGEGYTIIPISGAHQLQYACNVLNLGGSRIISVHAPSARQIVTHPAFKGDVRVIDFSSITSMYGSVHCASQVVLRVPKRFAKKK
ncbi:MAG: hypothetical protein J3K34DRAFT_517740 [Monoraphidium minutum]|nr:MAG: hypothetical protein J3K34DRAFT_517740 [Monoraphidium minutum]